MMKCVFRQLALSLASFALISAANAAGNERAGEADRISPNVSDKNAADIRADVVLSPGGADSRGTAIGTDCTHAAPCATPQKAAAMVAANIARDPNRDYRVVLRGGRYPMTSSLVLNSAHTVAEGHQTTWTNYPGEAPELSAGVDTAGTWSATTLPNGTGAQACVSTTLRQYAPLVAGVTTTNATRYVGMFWPYGKRASATIWPAIGQTPDYIPSNNTATFKAGESAVQISDLAQIGAVFGVATPVGNVPRYTKLFVLDKSAKSGPGTAHLALSAGGAPLKPTASGPAAIVGTDVGSLVPNPTIATFTQGSTAIGISDLSAIGVIGDPLVLVDRPTAGFKPFQPYWIKTKSAAAGKGTITVANAGPGTPDKPATASATVNMAFQALPAVVGMQRSTAADKHNRFPTSGDYSTAYNPGDMKILYYGGGGAGHALIPVLSATRDTVTMAANWFLLKTIKSGATIRRLNRFEDLGAGGAKGEVYTDRMSGLIYYTPRADETCDGLNRPGNAMIPGTLETLLKISSATADGSANGAYVGRMTFRGIKFAHTNTSVYTGAASRKGATKGYIGAGGSFPYGTLDPAIVAVGAGYVTFDHIEASKLGGSGISAAWGSNHVAITNSVIQDVGGHGVFIGVNAPNVDTYSYGTDPGYVGTRVFGPSTPSYNSDSAAANADLTGASDCCQTLYNNRIMQVGMTYVSSGCVSAPGWQNYVIDHNTMRDCPAGGLQHTSYTLTSRLAPSYGGVFVGPVYNTRFTNNEIGYVGYQTSLDGRRVPGAAQSDDFGAVYIQGPQDGDGSGADPRGLPLIYSGNVVHDVSGACWPYIETWGKLVPHATAAILDYHDGNSTNGVYQHDNLFYNSASVDGSAPCGTNLTQHTGNLRAVFRNNIWVGNYPAGWKVVSDYRPRADVPMFPQLAWRDRVLSCSVAKPCFLQSGRRLYSATAGGRSGALKALAPSCASGACPPDGEVVWTYLLDLAVNPAIPGSTTHQVEKSNITMWTVAGGGDDGAFPQAGWPYVQFSEFTTTDKNVYYHTGAKTTHYSRLNGETSWALWQSLGQDVNSGPGINADPNFVDPSGASGAAGFRFKTTGTGARCGGTGGVSPACALGFVPYDFSRAGSNLPQPGG